MGGFQKSGFRGKTLEERRKISGQISRRICQESFRKGVPVSYRPMHLNLPIGQMVEEYPDGKLLLVDVGTEKTTVIGDVTLGKADR